MLARIGRSKVFSLIVNEGLQTALVGAAVAVVGAVASARVLRGLLYGVETFDWGIYAGIIASTSPSGARRGLSSSMAPVVSLHAE
jgi:hypothetical protein